MVNSLNISDFVNGHADPPPAYRLPGGWHAWLFFGPLSTDLFGMPTSNIFQIEAAGSDKAVKNDSKSGRAQQRKRELEKGETERKQDESGKRGISRQQLFENKILEALEQKRQLIDSALKFSDEARANASYRAYTEL